MHKQWQPLPPLYSSLHSSSHLEAWFITVSGYYLLSSMMKVDLREYYIVQTRKCFINNNCCTIILFIENSKYYIELILIFLVIVFWSVNFLGLQLICINYFNFTEKHRPMWRWIIDMNNSLITYFGTLCFNRDFQFSGIVHPAIFLYNRELTVVTIRLKWVNKVTTTLNKKKSSIVKRFLN